MTHPNPLPRYYRLLITLIAGIQWLLVIAVTWFAPDWETIFRVPLSYFRIAMLGAAGLLTLYALLTYFRPQVARLLYQLLTRIRQHPSSIWLVPVMLIPALPLLASTEWVGYFVI